MAGGEVGVALVHGQSRWRLRFSAAAHGRTARRQSRGGIGGFESGRERGTGHRSAASGGGEVFVVRLVLGVASERRRPRVGPALVRAASAKPDK